MLQHKDEVESRKYIGRQSARLREIIASTRCGGEKTFGLKLYVGVYAARQRVIEKISSRECRNYRIYL